MSFLLVPGAGGDAWYWHRLKPVLPGAVAVDLPCGDGSAGLAEYADAIVAAGAGLSGITMVAQSMGAFSAPIAASRLDVRRIVLVNAMIPAPGETAGEWWAATGQQEAAGSFTFPDDFFHDVPDQVRTEAFARGEPQQADRPFAEPWPLTAWPDIPTSGVAGADDRLFPVEFQQRVARERLGVELAVVPGGHLVALSRPEVLRDVLLSPGWRASGR